MSATKQSSRKPLLPAILIANDLRAGDVLFRGAHGWTRDPAAAAIATTAVDAEALEKIGGAAVARNEIVDAYLAEVVVDRDGRPTPKHFRERFRTLGPSVRPDLGKQADFRRYAVAAE